MKTSLTEIQRTENFLLGRLSAGETLLFRAQMLLDPQLRSDVSLHRAVHTAVRLYHRKKLKAEIALAGKRLFADPSRKDFKEEVMKNFKSAR